MDRDLQHQIISDGDDYLIKKHNILNIDNFMNGQIVDIYDYKDKYHMNSICKSNTSDYVTICIEEKLTAVMIQELIDFYGCYTTKYGLYYYSNDDMTDFHVGDIVRLEPCCSLRHV